MSTTAPLVNASVQHTLDLRRVYIFPTRHGFMLGSMVLVILLGSINYDNALGYLLSFLLFGLLLVATLHTYKNLAGLSYIGAEATPVFAGTTARFSVAFDNRLSSPRYSLGLAHWPRRKRQWRRRTNNGPTELLASMPAGDITRTFIEIDAPERGWLDLQRVRVTSVFPLGVLRAWAYFEDHDRCLVYPTPAGPLPLPIHGSSAEAASTGNRQGNEDFAGFRPYTPGDPIRAIAWKALARQEVVLVKRFTSGGSQLAWLRMVDCASLKDTEARLSQLAKWVIAADGLGVPYGLELPRLRLQPSLGSNHRHECLRALALYDRQ